MEKQRKGKVTERQHTSDEQQRERKANRRKSNMKEQQRDDNKVDIKYRKWKNNAMKGRKCKDKGE